MTIDELETALKVVIGLAYLALAICELVQHST